MLSFLAYAAPAQHMRLSADIALRETPVSCVLNLLQDLDFGRVRAAARGVTAAEVAPTGPAQEGRAPGAFSIGGVGARAYSVSVTFPAALRSADGSLPYRGAWAHAGERDAAYRLIPGAIYRGEEPQATSFVRYFRVGGAISRPARGAIPGVYVGKVAITTSCH